MTFRHFLKTAGAALAMVMAAPLTAKADTEIYDPWEELNRSMFKFNNSVDNAVIEPTARAYRNVVPRPARKGVSNFFGNLRTPIILLNDILQGAPKRAGVTTARFGINTTIGFFGLFDVATNLGLERHTEDFDQTLAVYGVPSGPYIILPLLGPTTMRGLAGRGVDIAADPMTWWNNPPGDYARGVRTGANLLTAREATLDPLEDLEKNSIDYYASLRSFYFQALENEIRNGENTIESLPDIDFDEFDDEEF